MHVMKPSMIGRGIGRRINHRSCAVGLLCVLVSNSADAQPTPMLQLPAPKPMLLLPARVPVPATPPVASPAAAAPQPTATQPTLDDLRRQLHQLAERVPSNTIFYHQITNPVHSETWATRLGLATNERARHDWLNKWLGNGRYPGLWTVEDQEGWFGKDEGTPVAITLKPGSFFFDYEDPKQKKIYDAWYQLKGKAQNPFDALVDTQGVPLTRRVAGIHAPPHGEFYRDMNIAGVVWYDVYGRRCPVILNAQRIGSVQFSKNYRRNIAKAAVPYHAPNPPAVPNTREVFNKSAKTTMMRMNNALLPLPPKYLINSGPRGFSSRN